MIRVILESHGIRCHDWPMHNQTHKTGPVSGMPCPDCGSVVKVCPRCHASIQATVRGDMPPKQGELTL